MAEGEYLRGESGTFYIDNNNAIEALIKNSATPISIKALSALIWLRIRDIEMSPWFARAPSKRNIDDLPTRYVKIPYQLTSTGGFGDAGRLNRNVNKTIEMITQGVPVEHPKLE